MSRRRNFIPGLTKKQSYVFTVGSAVAGGVVLYYMLRSNVPKLRSMYDWDDTISTVQGGQVQVRLPRGQYVMVSPDVLLLSQQDFGNDTHAVIMPIPVADQMYSIDTLFADQLTSNTYPIHIEAWPSAAFERNPRTPLPRSRAPIGRGAR